MPGYMISVDSYSHQNPTDWKHVLDPDISVPGSTLGCDYSGTVVKVGNNLTVPLKVGDRIAGAVHGGKYIGKGAFAEYARVESELAWKVPDSISLDKASSYGVPWLTVLHVSGCSSTTIHEH